MTSNPAVLSVSLLAAVTLLTVSGMAQGGVSWNQLSPASRPSDRYYHAMVSDLTLARIILFGGSAGSTQPLLSDTWSWSSGNWTQLAPAQSPPARSRHAMAYDVGAQQVVMFGGYGDSGAFRQDTWLWDGVNWMPASPAVSPAARGDHAMVYDIARQRVMMYGGYETIAQCYGDTWLWDGVSWTQALPPVAPPARAEGAMAYDLVRQQTLLFGGYSGGGNYLQDTWEWDGVSWAQRNPAQRPSARGSHSMAYDLARNRTVVGGGSTPQGFPGDTWEWDGANWTQMTPLIPFPNGFESVLAIDAGRQRLLAFGGSGLTSWSGTSEYGSYTVSPAFHGYGAGCGGSAGIPTIRRKPYTAPWIGYDYTVELGNIPPGGIPFMIIGLSSRSLQVPGLSGCTQLNSAEAVVLLPSGATASWSQFIPAAPALVGVSLFYQGVMINAGGANALGVAMTFGLEATIGMW